MTVKKYQAEIAKGMPPGMILLSSAVRTRSELDDAIKQVAAQPNGALIDSLRSTDGGPPSRRSFHRRSAIGLPLIHPYQYFSAAGGLQYRTGPTWSIRYRRAAGYVMIVC